MWYLSGLRVMFWDEWRVRYINNNHEIIVNVLFDAEWMKHRERESMWKMQQRAVDGVRRSREDDHRRIVWSKSRADEEPPPALLPSWLMTMLSAIVVVVTGSEAGWHQTADSLLAVIWTYRKIYPLLLTCCRTVFMIQLIMCGRLGVEEQMRRWAVFEHLNRYTWKYVPLRAVFCSFFVEPT